MKKLLLLGALMIMTQSFAQSDSTSVDNFQNTDKVLATLVQKGIQLAEKTGDFVIEQAPELLQEFYTWNLISNIFWMVFAIIILLSVIYIPKFWGKKEEIGAYDEQFLGRYYYHREGPITTFFVGLVISVLLFVTFLYDTIYLLVAPKLYIIDYFIK